MMEKMTVTMVLMNLMMIMNQRCSFVILAKKYQKIMLIMAMKTVPMVPMNLMTMRHLHLKTY